MNTLVREKLKKSNILRTSRVLLFFSSLALAAVIWLPIWRIELDAPQYPEGLALQIHANDIKGDVDIINGLNHYIGMKTLHKEDFVEFSILPYIILFFAMLMLVTMLVGKKRLLFFSFGLLLVFGVIAMMDFWRWEYDYGHDLNPDAAIQVPGMAYQPPLIGFKQLLNFGAYSIPDIGGWLFIAAGFLVLTAVILEIRVSRRSTDSSMPVLLPLLSLLVSCQPTADPIVLGKDHCAYCKMSISDPRYGAAVLTLKGRTYKYDDVQCMIDHLSAGGIASKQVKQVYVVDYAGSHLLIPVEKAILFHSETLHSPMEGNIVAFLSMDSLKELMNSHVGDILKWDSLKP